MKQPIKIGIVGLGRAGWKMHFGELNGKKDMFRVAAVCDVLEDRRNRVKEQFDCKTYGNIEDLIADPEVELVDIATRSKDHFDHAVLALKAGKHVFLEKPICLDYEQASKLMEIAEQAEGKLFIRHNRRFDADFMHVQEIIASGILGEVYEIRLARHSYSRRDDWQTIKEHGGGQLLNWGPHVIDHALQFLDYSVESMYSDLKCVVAVGDAEDHVKIVLKGTKGLVVDLEISGGVSLGCPVFHVFGTKGSLKLTGKEITLKYLDPTKQLVEKVANPGTPGETFGTSEELPWIEEIISVKEVGRHVIWDKMYEAIREGAEFPIHLEEALAVMEVISSVKEGTEF